MRAHYFSIDTSSPPALLSEIYNVGLETRFGDRVVCVDDQLISLTDIVISDGTSSDNQCWGLVVSQKFALD